MHKIISKKFVQQNEAIKRAMKDRKPGEKVKVIYEKNFKVKNEGGIRTEFMKFKEQNSLIKHLVSHGTKRLIGKWHKVSSGMPKNIYSFFRRALILSLPNKTYLKRWNPSSDDLCNLCGKKQTQLHVFSNCEKARLEGRYTGKHNLVLWTVTKFLETLNEIQLFADLGGYTSPSSSFRGLRPDTVLKKDKDMLVIQVTVCYEANSQRLTTIRGKIFRFKK